jgi:hypothetical protein
MNKLKVLPLNVKPHQKFEYNGKGCDGFTKGRVYFVSESCYNPATGLTDVTFQDDDFDSHKISQKFLTKNFIEPNY